MKIKFIVQHIEALTNPRLIIDFIPTNIMLSGCLIDAGDDVRLLDFVKSVVEQTNAQEEFWTNGYTVKLVKKYDAPCLKIYFRLAEGQGEPIEVFPSEFAKIVKIWLEENKKFKENKLQYQISMLKKGANIIIYDDYREEINNGNSVRFNHDTSTNESGCIIVTTKEDKQKLKKILQIV